ncbi:MAG: hypothetical protein AAF235_11045, partial [Planctomycetota bacterium]
VPRGLVTVFDATSAPASRLATRLVHIRDEAYPKIARVPAHIAEPPRLIRGVNAAKGAQGTQTIGRSFDTTSQFNAGAVPPDTMGAAGPDHVVSIVNGGYEVFTKDGVRTRRTSLASFFRGAGLAFSDVDFVFDPRIVFDSESERWFAVAADFPFSAGSSIALAVSNGTDPSNPADWTAFRIDFDPTNQSWIDFPGLGIDASGVYVSGNMFAVVGLAFNGTSLLVVPKADLIAASPTAAGASLIQNLPSNAGFALQPVVDLDGTGLPTPVLADDFTIGGTLGFGRITGSIASPSYTLSPTLFVPPFNGPPNAQQSSSGAASAPLDSGDTRFGSNVILRNGELWAVQGVDVDGRAAIRWLRINESTRQVIESGTLASSTFAVIFPSIAVTESGGIVVGCTVVGPSQPASAAAFIGLTDGTTTEFGPPIVLREGTANYENLDSFGRNRWGDYSATTVDPSNPDAIWTFQEFVLQQDVWGTHATEIIPGAMPLFESEIIDLGDVSSATGLLDLELCGSSFDTELALWDGLGRVVAVNDNAMACPSGQSGLFGLALPPGDYVFGVTGFGASFGDGYASLTSPSAGGSISGTVNSASFGGSLASGETQYYRFRLLGAAPPAPATLLDFGQIAGAGGSAQITLCGSFFDTEVAIWNGQGELLGQNDDNSAVCGGFTVQSALTVSGLAEDRYYFAVSGFDTVFGDGFFAANSGET